MTTDVFVLEDAEMIPHGNMKWIKNNLIMCNYLRREKKEKNRKNSVDYFFLLGAKKFCPVITDIQVLSSSSFLAFFAIAHHCLLDFLFCASHVACSISAIWRVESSASAVKVNSASDTPQERFLASLTGYDLWDFGISVPWVFYDLWY